MFKLPSLRRGSQDLLLLHGLGVTSRELPMPFEVQKINRLKRGSRCPLKDYNQIFIASEPICYLTLVIITRGKRKYDVTFQKGFKDSRVFLRNTSSKWAATMWSSNEANDVWSSFHFHVTLRRYLYGMSRGQRKKRRLFDWPGSQLLERDSNFTGNGGQRSLAIRAPIDFDARPNHFTTSGNSFKK